jgi:C-terminal processing protease CtpA/Prc
MGDALMRVRLGNGVSICGIATFSGMLLLVSSAAQAQHTIGFERDRMKLILGVVSKQVEKKFYDLEMKGLHWAELTAETRAKIDSATSVSAMVTAIFAQIDKLQDSHTVFAPPERGATAQFGFRAKPFGDRIRIYEIDENGPAAVAGLQLGDEIIEMNSYPAERASWALMNFYFRILNPAGTFRITFTREGGGPREAVIHGRVKWAAFVNDLTEGSNIYDLVRQSENEWAREKEKTYATTGQDGIGRIGLPDFSRSARTLNLMSDQVKNARAVIIDLRDNPGGAVDALTRFAGYFEPKDVVIGEQVGREGSRPMKVRARGPKLAVPLFILVDSESSSAAEIFARHFQRTGRATVIGERTAGRVTVARYFSFSSGADTIVPYGVQVAVFRLVLPDGEELEKRGVTPDRICMPTGADLREGDDPCMALAESLAREALGLSVSAADH